MKAAVIGGTGRAGSQIVEELARRGHQVTALARNADKAQALAGVAYRAVDMHDAAALTEALRGHDVVVSAVRFSDATPAELISAVKASGVPRYLVVGGAASLTAGGGRLFDSPHFPEAYKPEAGAGTGKFRLGGDELLTAADGKSSISFPDYAFAMADEIETPKHRRKRFTVGY